MPLIEISMFPQSAKLKERLTKNIADVVSQETSIPKDIIWIIVRETPTENWLVGGLTVKEIQAKK